MTPPAGPPPADPIALLRTRSYLGLLVLAAIVGVPVSAAAYGFLALVAELQEALFTDLPQELGYDTAPLWWPLPLLAAGGLLTALAIQRLPGTGGHSPADGFKPSGPVPPVELPGILLAALATLSFGAVLGPEAPLILMGSGLGMLAVRLAARDVPERGAAVIAAAGSFAAISALLGSPLLGAFLLLEAAGLGGPMLGVILLPGLLAAGIGSLIFVGLDSITGLGTFSLSIPGLPPFHRPTVAMFAWAIGFGVAAAFLGEGVRRLAFAVRPLAERRMITILPLLGLMIGALAVLFDAATDHPASAVLFSGQEGIASLIHQAADWSVGALLLLLACKGLAYALSLSALRGGLVFPAVALGAVGGIAASHLPGLALVPAVAMGIGAMATVMLRLPLSGAMLAALLLAVDALAVLPLVIVAVVAAYVTDARLTPAAEPDGGGRSPQRDDDAGARAPQDLPKPTPATPQETHP